MADTKCSQFIDVQVGAKIRLHRMLLGLSQSAFANRIGVSPQQVQKYENGKNRVGASRLHRIAEVLSLSMAELFVDRDMASMSTDPAISLSCNAIAEFLSTNEGLQLNRAFIRISNARLRRRLIDLVRTLADDALT